ncbi:hypothetical protein [Demequina zhanjiangensis]|uniref:Uncharacterized protein n=1 Tax=Demequina zhanjiangensis TaxID=3051659 RepID=A0ABT8FX14_9MICO|nr:hypothetical protein [Demequina sp. SYSU T00b26]MDN4471436.1 hypothetical protein [Demequina sp. SYSU T00b26]
MRIRPIDLVDVLAYLIVLGAFIQLFPQVISESFLMAVLTAAVLKIMLEAVLWAKKVALGRVRNAGSKRAELLNATTLVLVLPGSKLVVIETIGLLFGDAVHLGGFFQVTALIIALTLARAGLRRAVATS